NRYLVYREDSITKMSMPNTNTPTNMKQSSKAESFTVNDPVSPDVFQIAPPPGAKEIDESKFMPTAKEAPQTPKYLGRLWRTKVSHTIQGIIIGGASQE